MGLQNNFLVDVNTIDYLNLVKGELIYLRSEEMAQDFQNKKLNRIFVYIDKSL